MEKVFVQQAFTLAGIEVNGTNPWDIRIHDDNFYQRLIHEGTLGFGESYMDRLWDCDRLDLFLEKIYATGVDQKVTIPFKLKINYLLTKIFNFQTKRFAKEVGYKHYDLGNTLFEKMLDKHMMYSCGYWKDVNNLEEAQEAKLDLICRKLYLKPGMRLLDIGCGWGGLARFAAEHYQVSVTGITISKEQWEYAKNHCQNLPVDIRLTDYRDLHENYDRIVSVGMFEHVGHLNYRTYMQVAHRNLKEGGLFLLHTIGYPYSTTRGEPWLNKYIFPHGMIPSISQLSKAAENLFIIEDLHNFGPYYDQTLMAWHENFNNNFPALSQQYDQRFFRMWNFYLLACAASFRARQSQLWQVILSKGQTPVYEAVR